ncbi:putative amidoligase enzyme [Bacillus phage vB_BceS-M2]
MRQNTKELTHAVTGREEKTCGVEMEFFGIHKDVVVAKLNEAGIAIEYQGYTHAVQSTWKLVYDASVTSTGTGVGNGLELVSPPLKVAEMAEQLETICGVLNEIGAKVDKTCGLHIHHHIDDLDLQGIKNIYELYNKHAEHIDATMPKSRRGSTQMNGDIYGYCKPISETELRAVRGANSVAEIKSVFTGSARYRVINFQAYVKYGTIEFRQHSGTVDFTKIMMWLRTTQALVATAAKKKSIKPMSETAKKRQTEAFSKELGLEYTFESIYARDRKAELKREEERRQQRAQQRRQNRAV